MANIITRRSFLKTSAQAAALAGLASLTNIPPFLRRALAEGNIGISGKKLLFIFLRGGNDGVNNIIPI
ncbi:MAG TPA: twin-arginine translocation signal domain-containing protein, partial [Verrucomicrobiae bacterium]